MDTATIKPEETPDETDVQFTTEDDRNRALLEQFLQDRGFIRHPFGFWIAPGFTLKAPVEFPHLGSNRLLELGKESKT